MLTRCPACETHFRVTADQLKVRSGRVRCGECQHVFNALDTLIEEPLLVVAPLPSESPLASSETVPPGIDVEPAAFPDAEADADFGPPSATAEPVNDRPDQLAGLQAEPPEPVIPDLAESAEPAAAAFEAAETDSEASDWSETFPEPQAAPRRWPWAIGSLLALIALGLQAALAFRVELAVVVPEARPALSGLCGVAGCEVGLPAKVALVSIEASDLRPAGGNAGSLALAATLKNRAPFAQQFPHLELTLTDTADKAIARKVLAPADYLPPKTSLTDGMPPNADVAISLDINLGEMAASGYRLYLFYP